MKNILAALMLLVVTVSGTAFANHLNGKCCSHSAPCCADETADCCKK